jgi:Asp-tRNA(Asn)/Glu-tRNA(Gln) amidotransferase A subunit family amidase
MTMGSVPVRHAEPGEESYEGYKDDRYTKIIRESLVGTAGLPIGVQVCSLRYQEEKCLRVMKEIQRLVEYKH